MAENKTDRKAPTFMDDFLEYQRKVSKAASLILKKDEVDVGTAPNDVVHTKGKMQLRYYKGDGGKDRVPVILIYALVNKPYILDLQPDRSVIRTLSKEGFDIYLIDWGTPTAVDKYLTLDDYINRYIDEVVDIVCERHKIKQVNLLGYCMGGTMTTMYSTLHPDKVKNIVLMAAPLDFDVDTGLLHIWSRKEYFDVDRVVDVFGNIPMDYLNGAYALLDPLGNNYMKYLNFVEKVDDEKFVQMFLRMEKWINDGIPVAGETFREFIKKGYQENQLINNRWELEGQKIDLKEIKMPVLNLIGAYDHLVPPESSKPILSKIGSKDKKEIIFPTGHIGLSVSSKSHARLWPEIGEWLRERSSLKEENKTPKKKPSPKQKGKDADNPKSSSASQPKKGTSSKKSSGQKPTKKK